MLDWESLLFKPLMHYHRDLLLGMHGLSTVCSDHKIIVKLLRARVASHSLPAHEAHRAVETLVDDIKDLIDEIRGLGNISVAELLQEYEAETPQDYEADHRPSPTSASSSVSSDQSMEPATTQEGGEDSREAVLASGGLSDRVVHTGSSASNGQEGQVIVDNDGHVIGSEDPSLDPQDRVLVLFESDGKLGWLLTRLLRLFGFVLTRAKLSRSRVAAKSWLKNKVKKTIYDKLPEMALV